MPDPSPLDLSPYLDPIAVDDPSGESLRYESEYADIERAREEDVEAGESDPWRRRNAKKADWEAVISIGLKALKDKTKDLEIAAWVAEALAHRRGLAGLRDGLRLVRELQDAFWETAHPSSGDLELREGVYEFLDDQKRLPWLIRAAPLVSVPGLPAYSLLKYKESRAVKNILLKEPERRDELKADGKVLDEEFDGAADATDRAFYVATVDLLGECLEAANQLNLSIRAEGHYGRRGPALTQTVVALEEVAGLARQLLAKKPAPEPDPAEEPAEPESPWPDEGGSGEGESPDEEARPSWESPPPDEARPAGPGRRKAPRAPGGPISGPEDARARIVEASAHLRQADPADPLAYLAVRALAMGGLYRSPGPIDPSMLRPPASEDRQALRRLANDGSWAELLERAESILSRPEGAGWLDARRLALRALAELGFEGVARASRAVLGAELRDYPDWPRSELDDGTPCAGSETRAWIEETFPARAEEEPSYQPPAPAYEGESPAAVEGDADRPPDPWEQARELHQEGRSREAVALMGQAAREARTGRERFLRTFQQAELCLMMGRPGVALPLLEGLARQIDELRLDRWEDPALCARVVAALYQCVRGRDEARARAIYDRLCQLDIAQALSLGDGPEA